MASPAKPWETAAFFGGLELMGLTWFDWKWNTPESRVGPSFSV